MISAGIGIFSLPIYTRFLSPSDYGIVALFIIFGQASSGLVSLGLQSASYRYYFKYKDNLDEYKTLNSSILIFLFLVYVIGGFLSYFFGHWLSITLFNGELNGSLIYLSFLSGCMEYLFSYFTYLLTAQIRSITFAIIIVLRAIIKVMFALYFIIIHSLTYMALIYATILNQIIMVTCLLILISNLLRLSFSAYYFKKSIKFSYPMLLRLIIGMIHRMFDKIMLTNFSGLASVGYYSFGEKFANLLKVFMDSIGKAWSPFFQNKAHENTEEAKNELASRYLEMSFTIFFIGYFLISFSEEMVLLLTTKEFYPAMYIIPIYIFYYLIGIFGMLSINQIQFSEKTFYILPASIVSVVLNISLNVLLIPNYGALGAVMALFLASLFSSLIHMYFGNKLFPIQVNWWKFAMMFLLTVIFSVPTYYLMASEMNYILKILAKFICISVFFIFGLKFNFISKESIDILYKKINPKLI